MELSASQPKNVSKTVEERRIFGASLPASVSFLRPWGHIFLIKKGLFHHNGKVHIVKLPVFLRTIPFFCPGAYLPTYLFAYLHIYLSNLI